MLSFCVCFINYTTFITFFWFMIFHPIIIGDNILRISASLKRILIWSDFNYTQNILIDNSVHNSAGHKKKAIVSCHFKFIGENMHDCMCSVTNTGTFNCKTVLYTKWNQKYLIVNILSHLYFRFHRKHAIRGKFTQSIKSFSF